MFISMFVAQDILSKIEHRLVWSNAYYCRDMLKTARYLILDIFFTVGLFKRHFHFSPHLRSKFFLRDKTRNSSAFSKTLNMADCSWRIKVCPSLVKQVNNGGLVPELHGEDSSRTTNCHSASGMSGSATAEHKGLHWSCLNASFE